MQSLMVYQNNNDFFHVPPMLDENVAKLMNNEQIENYIASASTSPVQDYIMVPSYHPQQQHQNQRQHQLQQFPVASMIPQSAPSSPQYAMVKSEESQPQPALDYLFPPTFEITTSENASSPVQQDQHHILPSQRSPQQTSLPYAGVSLFEQQRQRHHQQQQQHAQQLRLQHQQQFQQQLMYEPAQSSATTSSILSTMVSAAAPSSTLFAPSTITTSAPFFHSTTLAPGSYTPSTSSIHPAAPKRKREESVQVQRPISPQLSIDAASCVSGAVSINSNSEEPPTKKTTALMTSASDKSKMTRSIKVTKTTTPSSPQTTNDMTDSTAMTPARTTTTRKIIKKTTTGPSESRESSEQPESIDSLTGAARPQGNVTHPRRAAQNRAAQRTFRNRRKAYIKELEQKVQEIDRTREVMESIHNENREVWRRLQILEGLIRQTEVPLPSFTPMTPIAASSALVAGLTNNGSLSSTSNDSQGGFLTTATGFLQGGMASSEEDDGDFSDSHLQQLQF